jgi:RNA-splicing ligase RtcB
MKLFRVGSGNISEQNPNAFKNVFEVTEVMKKYNLGNRIAKLRPICSMKG